MESRMSIPHIDHEEEPIEVPEDFVRRLPEDRMKKVRDVKIQITIHNSSEIWDADKFIASLDAVLTHAGIGFQEIDIIEIDEYEE